MPRTSWSVGLLLLVCACRSDPAEAPPSDSDDEVSAASTGTDAASGTATTLGEPAACARSNECDGDTAHCVAPYDAGLGEIGAALCVESCVQAGDLARACIDDDSCCAGLTCNPVDGFCASEAVDETTSSTGTHGETDTDTSTSSGGSSGASSSTSA